MPVGADADELIRQTDYDALSSRLSCYLKGYNPEDGLLLHLIPLIIHYQILSIESQYKGFAIARKLKSQFFSIFPVSNTNVQSLIDVQQTEIKNRLDKFKPLKSPVINRGTYLRTRTITDNILKFIESHDKNTPLQIVSLGAGNDTRCFPLVERFPNLHYFEIDVESTTRLKKLAILSSPTLSSKVGATPLAEYPTTSSQVLAFDPTLHTERYHLLPLDLRTLKPNIAIKDIPILDGIDTNVSTLIISECCICYLSKEDSNNLLSFWYKNLNNGKFLIYEPLGGNQNSNTNYGQVMIQNLICRGIEMPTLLEYGTVDSQTERLKKLIPNGDVKCRDMKTVYDEIDFSEKSRLNQLEMLDELEELNLINSHYCLIDVKWEAGSGGE